MIGEEVVVGFFLWVGRGILEVFYWIYDLSFLPRIISFPGTLILTCIFGADRRNENSPDVKEYVVGAIFWLAVLFLIYLYFRPTL
tara:strand:+ start:418 stop:672 length:255 start_codon:yes stop_codon:yes gene_type:complete